MSIDECWDLGECSDSCDAACLVEVQVYLAGERDARRNGRHDAESDICVDESSAVLWEIRVLPSDLEESLASCCAEGHDILPSEANRDAWSTVGVAVDMSASRSDVLTNGSNPHDSRTGPSEASYAEGDLAEGRVCRDRAFLRISDRNLVTEE